MGEKKYSISLLVICYTSVPILSFNTQYCPKLNSLKLYGYKQSFLCRVILWKPRGQWSLRCWTTLGVVLSTIKKMQKRVLSRGCWIWFLLPAHVYDHCSLSLSLNKKKLFLTLYSEPVWDYFIKILYRSTIKKCKQAKVNIKCTV